MLCRGKLHIQSGIADPEYLAATDEFYRRHLCRVVPMPQDLVDTIEQMEAERVENAGSFVQRSRALADAVVAVLYPHG